MQEPACSPPITISRRGSDHNSPLAARFAHSGAGSEKPGNVTYKIGLSAGSGLRCIVQVNSVSARSRISLMFQAAPPVQLAAHYRAIAREHREAAAETDDASARTYHIRFAEGWEVLAKATEAAAEQWMAEF
jgi:hypothetical protein